MVFLHKLIISYNNIMFQHSQVELVLLVFRRLAEDIHLFESDLPSKRKKEMSAALSENIRDIFAFLVQNLEVIVLYATEYVICLICTLNS